MFTGIIEEVGRIVQVRDLGGGKRFTIQAKMTPALESDQSVSVNGACQTVVSKTADTFDVEAVEETLKKTTMGAFSIGEAVNLERAMRTDGRLDGHLVQGHVDDVGLITAAEVLQTSWLYRIRFPERFRPYLIPVGSVTVDGISLTVARLDEHELTVSIIPHTFQKTIVPAWKTGRKVNLEFDLIGKYVVGWLTQAGSDAGTASKLTPEWLKRQGF